MKNGLKNFISPFVKIAGGKALLWGVAGLAVSVAAASFSGWHAHGLLHFGPAQSFTALNPENVMGAMGQMAAGTGMIKLWWLSALEYLVIWLVPAIVIYGLGAALSSSRIRMIDVFGTVAFSMLPLSVMNLMFLTPEMGLLLDAAIEQFVTGKMAAVVVKPVFIIAGVATTAVLALMLVWLFGAVKISCNLKGWRLWTVWLAGVVGGDILCRFILIWVMS